MGRGPEAIKQPLAMVLIIFLVIMTIIMCRATLSPYPFELGLNANMPLGRLIHIPFSTSPINYIFSIVILLSSAMLLTRIVVRYSVSTVRTYLPMVLFAILAFGIYVPIGTLCASLVSFILILSSIDMMESFKRSYQFGNVFKSAFCLGLLPMLYSPTLILTIILPITLFLYHRTLREWLVGVVGLSLPLVLCSVCWWINGESLFYIWDALILSLSTNSTASIIDVFLSSNLTIQIYLGLVILFLLYSIFSILSTITAIRTRARKIYLHFIWLFILCLVMIFLPCTNIFEFNILAVPASIISTAFFIKHRGWIATTIYAIALLFVLIINITPFF